MKTTSSPIDRIFCGNAYHWFSREKAVPEFRRILRGNGSVVIATLGGGNDAYEAFCEDTRAAFDKNSRDGLLEMQMRLHCVVGSAEHLAL